jgi:hypothetical protein
LLSLSPSDCRMKWHANEVQDFKNKVNCDKLGRQFKLPFILF